MQEETAIHEADRIISDLPILTTKLYRPPVTPDLIPRERLLALMERNREHPLALISAPAGYGKSVLARAWLHACDCPSAWVSLDENDDDLTTFLRYLLAALSRALPSLNLKTWALLNAPGMPNAPVVARYLLNDLAQIETPFILALDDLHSIKDQAIYDLLTELLRHPAPALHLVLISRTDPPLPIASLRASRKVTEIRAHDLQFTPAETAQLLRNMLNHEVGEDLAFQWTQKTEGWVTGLRLAALSLRRFGQEQALHANIPPDSRYLQEYLLAEILAHLSVASQAWLLKSALLDRFCASLIEAVCRTDADPEQLTGQNFIDWLERENLFLIPLDDRGEWFRFHHLFQELLNYMLQTQISTEEITTLQMHASHWFAENGLLDEALQYALRAGDLPAATNLIAQNRYDLMNLQEWHRLKRWLGLLPVEFADQNPYLLITKAYLELHMQYPSLSATMHQLEYLLTKLPQEDDVYTEIQVELSVLQGTAAAILGRPQFDMAEIRKSHQMLPPQAHFIRSLACGNLAGYLQMQGKFDQSIKVFREALAESTYPVQLQPNLLHYLCLTGFMEGDLATIITASEDCLRQLEGLRLPWTVSHARHHLGVAYYLRNEIQKAEAHLLALLKDRATSAPSYLANGIFTLALIYHAQNRPVEAAQVIQLLEDQFREMDDSAALAFTRAFQVELALRQGKMSKARQMSISVDYELRPLIWFSYVPQLTPIKLLLAEGDAGSLAKARARLDVLDEDMRRINRNNIRLDVLALEALVCKAQGDEQTAFEKLRTALELGIIGGSIRSFVDLGAPMANLLLRLKDQGAGEEYAEYIDQILAAFPESDLADLQEASQPARIQSIEPLTRRELQVLKVLATDLPMRDIAARLHISTGTLNSHTKNIYSKMGVHKRAQAVQQGKALGLI